MSVFSAANTVVNKVMIPLLGLPVVGPRLRRSMTFVSYTGRKSGRQFRLPVAYRRSAEDPALLLIGVAWPDKKTWWRNFTGEGSPVVVELDGTDRRGHATARRDEQGQVCVTVELEAT